MKTEDKVFMAIFGAFVALMFFVAAYGFTYSWHVSNQKVAIQIACIQAGMEWDERYDGQCVKEAAE